MADTWIIDLGHYLNSDGSIAPKSGAALCLATHFAEIVQEASADIGGEVHFPKVRCRRRPNRKQCIGEIDSILDPEHGAILWRCPVCGDNGAISGWEGTLWDLTDISERQ